MLGSQDAWRGFIEGAWSDHGVVAVDDFVRRNHVPYNGDAEFLADVTEKTRRVWTVLADTFLPVERQRRVYDVELSQVAGISAFEPGYICEDDDVVVGLQTDTPLKRAMMPRGGWRMVEVALREAGCEVPDEVREIYTEHVKTHNDGVFDAYTGRVRDARSSHLISGLPDAYGRGRLIPEVTRVALYGVNYLIEAKQRDKNALEGSVFASSSDIDEWVRIREEIAEQIKALKQIITLGQKYGFDVSLPATNAREAIQWTYIGYLAAIKSQDGAAMSIGRLSHFFDIYIERDIREGTLTEGEAQELIDHLVIKLRIVRFLRTKDYDQIFSGDPYWATWTDGGLWDDGTHQITKTSFRLLRTLENLGAAPEPNITILWDEKLPAGYKNYCAHISIQTSAIQYESDALIRQEWGDYAAIACCVSPVPYGKGIQYFGARANLGKTLLYALNNGRDELTGKQVIPSECFTTPDPHTPGQPLDYKKVWNRFKEAMAWVAETYTEALNIVHYMHDKYNYEAAQHALIDTHPIRVMGCGIAGLSVVTDSLSAIKHAHVTPIVNADGIITDFHIEGHYPHYGNDIDDVDQIAVTITKTFNEHINTHPLYRGATATQSVLTITSNVVYGKHTGTLPATDVHTYGQPFSPGANPSNGKDTHGALASMLSVAKIDYRDALDGISLTNTITPNTLGHTDTERVHNLGGILDAGFNSGLYHVNINVLNKETLIDAMEHPEDYPSLTVRVSGYAVNFVRLTKEQQHDILSRTFHGT